MMYGMNYYQPNYPQTQDERIWVQNQTAAEAYLVAPNSFVRLWDSQRPYFYEKRADATGRPLPLDVYTYAKIEPQNTFDEGKGISDYQKELDAITKRIEALERGMNNEQSNANDTGVPEV